MGRIIMGIDPGLATIGYGVLQLNDDHPRVIDFGVITTNPKQDFNQRILTIYQDLLQLLDNYKPDEVYLEELFFSKNVKTAMGVSQARGAIVLTIAKFGLTPISVTPNEVKLAVTGDGRADKRQIQDMLKIQFGLSALPQPDDAADALAIAVYGASLQFRQ